jgi:hypothetical protein
VRGERLDQRGRVLVAAGDLSAGRQCDASH